MWKVIALSICAASLPWAAPHAGDAADIAAPAPARFGATSVTTKPPDFESLRIKGYNLPLPGPQDTIDPDVGGIRSRLASHGIGYFGYTSNSYFDNLLSGEHTTFGRQTYNGQKPTFFSNNVMLLTYDLSRFGIPDGQIVFGGVYNFDTWDPGGPNALSLATLSYYQTFLNKQIELKFGYLQNVFEFWGPFLAGNLSASIFGPSAAIPVETGINAFAWTTPSINIKFNGPDGFYNKLGIQRASSPDGPVAEKAANPTGFEWSTPNTGVLVINELGYRIEAAPGQLMTWVRAAPMFNSSRYTDFALGGRRHWRLRSICSGRSTIRPTCAGGGSGRKGGVRRRHRNVCAAGIQSFQSELRAAPLWDRPLAFPTKGHAILRILAERFQPLCC